MPIENLFESTVIPPYRSVDVLLADKKALFPLSFHKILLFVETH